MFQKKLFVLFFVLTLFVSACGQKPIATEVPPVATNTPIPVPTATATKLPTATSIPPTPTPEFQQYFTEEFEKDLKYWSSYYIVDAWTGVIMKEPDIKPEIDNKSLRFDLPKFRWMYVLYDPFDYEDVRVEAQAENLGTNNNNVSLICRYTGKAWYEFNIANNGLYWIYSASVREDGFVQYKLLDQGGSNKIVQGNNPGKNTNIYAITCKGDTFTLYINENMTKEIKNTDLASGKVGVSISSFETAVNVKFNWVKISEP